MTTSRDREAETVARDSLAEFLRFAVPLRVAELLPLRTEWERAHPHGARRRRLPHGVVTQLGAGDALMFAPTSPAGRKAAIRSADALAWAVALIVVEEPAGADVLGVHFCARPHGGCPLDREHSPPAVHTVRWWEPLLELEALLDTEGIDDGPDWDEPPIEQSSETDLREYVPRVVTIRAHQSRL